MSESSPQTTPSTFSLWQRLARVWPYFGQRWWVWSLALGTTVISGLMEFSIPALLQPLLDHGFQSQTLDPWLVPPVLMVLVLLRSALSFVGELALARIANDGMWLLRKDMFDHVLRAELALFASESASSLSNTVVYEVQNGANMLVQSVLGVLRNAAMTLGLLGYLLWLNWRLTLIVLFVFPFIAWVVRVSTRRLYRLTQKSQTATDALAYVVEENVLTHRMVRLHRAEAAQNQRFDAQSSALRSLNMKATIASTAASPVTHTLISAALAVVITVALFQSRTQGFTVGSFTAFVSAMMMLLAPIKALSQALSPITRGLAALERGLLFLQNWPTEGNAGNDGKEAHSQTQVRGEIELKGLSVHYPGKDSPALDNIDLHIPAGQILALVGGSGSGKTTLANLLPRFVQPSAGSILLDGVALHEWDIHNLRSHIALVSQDVVMFNDSIAANVALGQEIDRDRITQCLHDAHLSDWLALLPQGIDSPVGHNATQLSGGQRQRLAIARALYKNATLLLLDEATSALDSESERLVQDALQRLMQGRTTLVIAHRLYTIEHADQILVLEHGRILESGTHKTLLAQNGRYAQLHQGLKLDAA